MARWLLSVHRRQAAGAAVAAIMCVTASIGAASAAGATVRPSGRSQPAVTSIGLDEPVAIAVVGGHLWIVNAGNDSVTEMTTAGKVLRTISGASYGFNGPDAVAGDGTDVFVVNQAGSVTELSATNGSLVQIVQGASYGFDGPSAILVHGGDVWVVNSAGNSVTEFSDSTGSLVQVLSNESDSRYGFDDPDAIALAGLNIWVTNDTGGSTTDALAGAATEFQASTGVFLRYVNAASDGLESPAGVAFDGTHLWISDSALSQVTEITTAGKLVQVITNSSNNANYGFWHPTVVVAHDREVYVVTPPGSSPMVTQIDSVTTDGNWYECNTNVPDPDFVNPTGLVVYNDFVWVVSPGDSTLTELSLADGGAAVNWYT